MVKKYQRKSKQRNRIVKVDVRAATEMVVLMLVDDYGVCYCCTMRSGGIQCVIDLAHDGQQSNPNVYSPCIFNPSF